MQQPLQKTGVWPWLGGLRLARTLLLLLATVDGQRREREEGLFPVTFNLATRASISVNATCGMAEPEVFCKLVEHVRLFPAENRQCDICDARSDEPALRHPITNAIDGSQSWWQSPTLTNGPEYNHVTITLDLQQVYQIAYVILKAANAPRPGNWILERSLDGETYLPWQYFVMEDRDCMDLYRQEPTIGLPIFYRDDQVICTSKYSALNPLEHGEIFISLINDRPGAFQPSKVLLDFTSARYIRMRFQKIRTLNADLMAFSSGNPDDIDDSVTRRYFYSVKDISIGGQCICYGHASFCRRHPNFSERLQCQCDDNTEGDNCEQCKPLFNQKPWQVRGTTNGECKECNCHNKADECVYNATVDARGLSLNIDGMYDGGGVCLNCRDYTTGLNCEKCLPGYYRPLGMTPDLRFPCRPCTCRETRSSTADCVQYEDRLAEGLRPGDCICKEGYAGSSCNQCAIGYYGYPDCQVCRCDPSGSVDPEACDRRCVCKANVAGSRCDACKQGYFHLDIDNPLGCTECFCFGVSRACDSVTWGLSKVHDMDGWVLSTLEPGGLTLLPRLFDGWLEAKVYLFKMGSIDPRSYTREDIHYWVAPMSYLGNRLSSYGGYLELILRYRLDNAMRNRYYLPEPNLILEGSNMTIMTELERLREDIEHHMRIRLHEDNWRHLADNRPVSREEMMLLLYNLERMLIRATHNTAQDTVYIKDVYLDMASPMVMDASSLKTVEQCRCPEGYAGLSCESCAPGWRRVGNQLLRGRCQKCQCNNHAHDCDPYTGRCFGCKHSTTGDNCERCLPGFYGDPRYGQPDDCKPCSCPLVSGNNFFAERCVSRPTEEEPDAYECVNCREGYTGVRCQTCAPGFYGNPIVPGGSCRRCSCGGNIDPSRPGSCNPVTGVCNLCNNNTEGQYCERCASGYYGSAVNGDCRPCQCSPYGSTNQRCDPRSGQCNCKDRFAGRRCDHCQRGYGNVEQGCVTCNCDRTGSESLNCDPVDGQCRCKPGVGGQSCDRCVVGYYGFSRSGCKDCHCYGPGTNNVVICDPNSGDCLCKAGVTGQRCDQCMDYHFGLGSDEGCARCDCDRVGSTDTQCDVTSGQCACRPGVGGRTCDRCLPGYYGFSLSGCQACEPCDKPGYVCNPVTGLCACPTNTEGPRCQVCVPDSWGYDKDGGCKLCNCSIEGSKSQQCNPDTGSCSCREGFHGYSCDRCLAGFHSFPECQECACNHAGSVSDTCPKNAQYCECNKMGQCYCKPNVEGQRCERCKANTFSLDLHNPNGCTRCYCFLRAQICTQAPYVWTTVYLPNLSTVFHMSPDDGDALQEKFGQLVITSDESYAAPELANRPVYWLLPLDSLDRDMVLSYNGRLQFLHYFEGPVTTSQESMPVAPLVILIGNNMELHAEITDLEPSNPHQVSIPLHEEYWHFPGETDPVDRRFLMIALQNVSAILVRATQNSMATYALLEDISIERAVPMGSGVNGTERAVGVEICECPSRFSGESCQNPGTGHFRVPPIDTDINLSSPEIVIGYVRPCRCFQHSQLCDPDTGECLVCLHNTAGRNCERCAEGYFGVATRGTPDDCRPCQCPLPEPSNNFSPTCEDGSNGLLCTACPPEYRGVRCERCAPGYYGNPQTPGDTCKPCRCNPQGSADRECDPLTGQCSCLQGISGRTCEVCTDLTAGVQSGRCVSCYTGCTGVLLDDLSNITIPLLNFDTSGAVYPWEDLYRIKRQAEDLRKQLSLVEQAGGNKVNNLTNEVRYVDTVAERLIKRIDTEEATACKIKEDAASFYENVTALQKEVQDAYEEIRKIVDHIKNLTEKLRGNYEGFDMATALQSAKEIFNEIKARNFTPQDEAAYAENEAAEMLIERIRKLGEMSIDTNSTQDHLGDLNSRLKDLLSESQEAMVVAEEAMDKIRQLMDLLDKLDEIKKKILEMTSDAYGLLEEAQDLLEEADSALYTSGDRTDSLDVSLELLRERVRSLQKAVPVLETYVERAMDHAEMLKNRAQELDNLYELARNQSGNAVMAAKAYESIVNGIEEARKSAEEALDNARVSKQIAGVDNMTEEVAELMRRSRELKVEAEGHLDEARNLTARLKDLQDDLDVGQADHEDNQDLLDDITNGLKDLEQDLSDRIDNILPVIDGANKKTNDTLELLRNINRTEQESKLEGLEDIGDINTDLSDTMGIAESLDEDMPKLRGYKQKVEDRVAANARKALDISYDLDRLKAKIRDARNRVNDMKMSLKTDGQCYRTYRSFLTPSATNEVRFSFRPDTDVSDALLALLQQSTEEFLAIEIANQRVRFSWNSGSGVGTVTHDVNLEPDKWYHVMAKRVGSVGQLKVWPEDGQEDTAKKVTSSLGAGCSLMNLDENAIIYLAGFGKEDQLPAQITGQNFKGCMGEIFLDGHRLGVYNFKTNVKDHCDACEEVPQLSIAALVYVFNGRGFARYTVDRYNTRRTKIELEFKTFYEDSRIFFVGNENLGDFLSIELINGHVAAHYYMGGLSAASGRTVNTYNNNKWTKIVFDRHKLRAALIVEGEQILMEAPGSNSGLDMRGAPMYFGGLPTTLNTNKFRGLNASDFFYGCMRALSFYTLPPDEDSSTFVNVQQSSGCRENGINNVDFRGDGYLALKTEHIAFDEQKNDISLTFVTSKADGVILLARDIPGNNYYSLSLVGGRLDVRMKGEGTDIITMRSTETFNDGEMHCVSIIKDNQRLQLLANDALLGESEAVDVQFPSLDESSLYLGGYPAPNILDMAPTNEKFDGCISDVIVNGNLLSMSDATQYMRADVGRCRFTSDTSAPVVVAAENTEEFTTMAATTTTTVATTTAPNIPLSLADPQACVVAVSEQDRFEKDSHSVGLGDSFFAEVTKIRRSAVAKSFNFTFDFRTFYGDGLFGYLTNREKTFYLGVQLNKGRLEVAYIYDGDRVSLSFEEQLNDGDWHTVRLEKKNDLLSLSYDDEPKKIRAIDNRIDVRSPLHLGGPQKPEDFTDNNIDLVTHSVRGCIRHLEINQKGVNITDVKVIQDVGECYKEVEPGVYFGGDAWAAYENDFIIKDVTTFSLDFKTKSPVGILVSVGNDDSGFGLTLELHDGKIKFGLRNKNGEFRVESDNTNEFVFCDNRWHSVTAGLIDGQLSLQVDSGAVLSTPVDGMSEPIQTSNPLFVGGSEKTFKQPTSLSEDTFSGCLKKLVINEKTVDWYDIINDYGVRKNACPLY